MGTVGIRREDKHEFERRVPLTPAAVGRLTAAGVTVVVQPSTIRVFDDDAYREAGATLQEDLSGCDVVFAVKEIPVELLRAGGAYVFFSHTIKGQAHNMPLLRRLMELGAVLIDYERIVDEDNRRLVFFGPHAGMAGMIDTLAVLGRRLAVQGIDTPLRDVLLTHRYASLAAAEQAVREVGAAVAKTQLPVELAPFVAGFSGYGNVSQGAQQIFDLLPVEAVAPDELPALLQRSNPVRDRFFKVVFREEHLVEPVQEGATFELQDYYDHPERYRSIFERHAPHLSLFINAVYWTEAYPRLLSSSFLKSWFSCSDGAPRLRIVGDISCDIGGSVQCTVKATTPGQPAYIYDPTTGAVVDGYEGPGLAMMTTDCLPCELPVEASESFASALEPLVIGIAMADFSRPFDEVELPAAIKQATVLWRGELTEQYGYLTQHLS